MRWLNTLLQGLRSRKRRGDSELTTEALEDLQSRLSYDFKEPALLIQALKHRSYVYARQGRGVEANERLEYLGDAVLDLVVAEFLYRRFRDRREGDLTQMKSLVVSRAVLSRKSGSIDLGDFLLLSQEERGADNGGVQSSILSDGFEAIIGAMYLDGGLEVARGFIERVVLDDFEELHQREDFINFKSMLLEHTQSLGSGLPKYQVLSEEGAVHHKVFSIAVSVTGETVGKGQGRSKKEAQQNAAHDALQRLGQL